MKTIDGRIRKLEDRLWIGDGKPRILLVLCKAGWGLALDRDRCIQILGECGFLPTGPVGLVNLAQIPDGLNAEELERHLREDGAETRGFRGAHRNRRVSAHPRALEGLQLPGRRSRPWPQNATPEVEPIMADIRQ